MQQMLMDWLNFSYTQNKVLYQGKGQKKLICFSIIFSKSNGLIFHFQINVSLKRIEKVSLKMTDKN